MCNDKKIKICKIGGYLIILQCLNHCAAMAGYYYEHFQT